MTTTQDEKRQFQLEQEVLALQEERNQGLFLEHVKIQASDKKLGDWFGWSVAISGDWALVGAYSKDNSSGVAYIYTQSPNS